MSVPRTVTYRSLCERTFRIFDFTVNNMGGESQNAYLSWVADNTMLHRSLKVLDMQNEMEPAEAAWPRRMTNSCPVPFAQQLLHFKVLERARR